MSRSVRAGKVIHSPISSLSAEVALFCEYARAGPSLALGRVLELFVLCLLRAGELTISLISWLRAGVALLCGFAVVLSSGAGELALSLPLILSGVGNDQLRGVEVFECRMSLNHKVS